MDEDRTCGACHYHGLMTPINDMSKFVMVYACPNCGTLKVDTAHDKITYSKSREGDT